MKYRLITFILLISSHCCIAQEGSFTWVEGVLPRNGSPVWGTQGVAAPQNTPGSRESANLWVDDEGNIWVFGGIPNGLNGLGDLWMYDQSEGEWIWKKGLNTNMSSGNYGNMGIEASTNRPGARFGAASWMDDEGNLWLFGGNKPVSSGSPQFYNDLWKYNPQTNNWTWMNGSNQLNQNFVLGIKGVPSTANTPCASSMHACWKGNDGTFWLFGGIGRIYNVQGFLNQLWNYNPATNEWTWVSGGSLGNQNPVWGTPGVYNVANVPSSRYTCAGWMDNNGYIYIYGGNGIREQDNTVDDQMNDLWKFDPSISQWTFINGVIANGTSSTYGAKGVENSTNHPGSRSEMVYWSDDAGDLWFFGGHSQYNGVGVRADLWRLNTANNYWTYMHGSMVVSSIGSYGPQGVASTTYFPGARYLSAGAKDQNGDFWLIGGIGKDNNNQLGTLGDIWKYDAVNVEPPVVNSLVQNQTCGTETLVTIQGEFLAGSQLSVGGIAVTPSQISNGQIQFILTPSLSGEVIIANEYGQISAGLVELNIPTAFSFDISSCEPYTLNNITYDESGSYTQQLVNTAGCDSTVTLHLTINQATTQAINAGACEQYSLNGETYTTGGVYNQSLINSAGCDSLIVLNLEIYQTDATEWEATSCGPFEWNNILYTDAGTYTTTLINEAGCDSVVTLHLDITTIDTGLTVEGGVISCQPGQGTYQWIDCNDQTIQNSVTNTFEPTQSGSYAVVISNGECTATSECETIITNQTISHATEPVLIYPNPFNQSLFIECEAGTSVLVYDIAGKKVYENQLWGKMTLDTRLWNPGIYTLTLNSKLGLHQFTVVKI